MYSFHYFFQKYHWLTSMGKAWNVCQNSTSCHDGFILIYIPESS